MARLVDRLTASRSNLPDPEQVEMMSQSWGISATERILQTFRSYAVFGYASNSVVYACALARVQLLAQAQFKFQDLHTGRLYGNPELSILEQPWENGTTSDLIANMEQHDVVSGNSFVRRTGDTLVMMRPDWVDILSVTIPEGADGLGNLKSHDEVLGYLYSEGGYGLSPAVFLDVDEVVHWSPMPDPMSKWRGMSPMTPILREINADVSMTQHRQIFFDQAGTPNLVLKYQQSLDPTVLEAIRDRWRARFGGPQGAGSAVVLDRGGDLTVVGSTFESMRFTDLQNAGEVRISAAMGVPALVAGLIAGLDSAAYGTAYAEAYRAMANTTGAYLWGSLCAALSKLVKVPAGSRLWYDTTSIPALRDDEKDRHEATQIAAAAISTLLTAGYESDSIIAAVVSGDLTQLKHSGLVSVQLYKAEAKESPSIPIGDKIEPPKIDVGPPVAVARSEQLLEALVARAAEPAEPPQFNLTFADGAIQAHTTIADGAIRSETTVERSAIDVHVPESPAPQVVVENHVEPTPFRFDVPQAPAPEVTITNTLPTVAVELPARKTVTQVDRDASGLIRKTTSTETDA